MNDMDMKIQQPIKDQLAGIKIRWLAHANEADHYKNLYEEATLFLERAVDRLPEDHPLHPYSYGGLITEVYLSDLAVAFEELDNQPVFDPELDEVVGIEEVQLPDDYNGFDVAQWNSKAFESANEANESEENNIEENTDVENTDSDSKTSTSDIDRMEDEGGMIYETRL